MARPIISRLDRYILRQLITALVAVTTALVALIWLTQSLRFVELVVNRGLSLRVFLELTSLMIPGFTAVILPITTFVVVQFVYQRLAGDRELTVMRSAGLSPMTLARPALALSESRVRNDDLRGRVAPRRFSPECAASEAVTSRACRHRAGFGSGSWRTTGTRSRPAAVCRRWLRTRSG